MANWLLLKNEQEGRGDAVAIKGLEAASNLPESDVDRLVVAKAVFNGDSSGDAAKSLARGGGVALRLLARQYRNVWAAAPLKKLSVETLTPLSGSYDGDSGDLLYALVTFLSLAQDSDLIQAIQRDFAATGTLDSDGVVGPVKAVVLKIEAAIQKLPRGSIVFYPRHRPEGETRWIDEGLIVQARDCGIELQAVEFIEEALAVLGIEVLWWRRDQSPYRALDIYKVEHSPIFFGRDDQVTEFLDRLQQAAEAKRPGGLVEAASGAGKSSFVQAGLLARLRILPRMVPTPVEYAIWQPRLAGASHETEIDEAVLAKSVLLNWKTHAGVNSTGISGLNDLEDIQTLEDLGARLGKTALDDRLLLWVVDQFEELFTQKYTDSARVAFARFLAQLQAMGVWVIGTLRTEFKSRFMALADEQGKPLLVDVFKNLMFPLPRMPIEALGQMITEPARVAGVGFETRADGVRLDALLRQDALGADSMPLVGYALNELWLKKRLPDEPDQLGRKTPRLTFDAYKVICGGDERGGIRRVLGIEAERAFQMLPQVARDELPRLLDALAVPLEGEEKETARPAELAQWEEGTPGWHLIEALREKRLLVTEPATETLPAQVRVVHEALFDGWDRARQELEKSRETRTQIKRLMSRHDQWAEHGEPPDELLTSAADLELAATLRKELLRRSGLDRLLRFVDCSLGQFEKQAADALRASRATARRRRVTTATLSGMLVLLGGALLYSIDKTNEASASAAARNEALRSSAVRRVAAESILMLEGLQPGGDVNAIRALVGAYAHVQSNELLGAMQRASTGSEAVRWLKVKELDEHAIAVAYVADLNAIYTVHHSGSIRVFSADSLDTASSAKQIADGFRYAAAMDPKGRLVAFTDLRGRLQVFDIASGQQIGKTIDGGNLGLTKLAFDPTGKWLALAGTMGSLAIYDTTDMRALSLAPPEKKFDVPQALAFSPNGQALLVADSQYIHLWFSEKLKYIGKFAKIRPMEISAIAYDRDGRSITLGRIDGGIDAIALDSGKRVGAIGYGHKSRVLSISYSPDGRRVVSSSDDGTIRIWPSIRDSSPELRKVGAIGRTLGQVKTDALSRCAVWSETGRAWYFSRIGGETTPVSTDALSADDAITAAALTPDCRRIVVGTSRSKLLILGSAGMNAAIVAEHREGREIDAIAVSQDENRVLTAERGGMLRLWAVGERLTQVAVNDSLQGTVTALEFSADGKRFLLGTAGGLVQVRSAAFLGEVLTEAKVSDSQITSVAWSHDGKHAAIGSSESGFTLHDSSTLRQFGSRQSSGSPYGEDILSTMNGLVVGLQFGGDDKTIVSVSSAGELFERPAPKALPDLLCSKLTTGFSRGEWDMYIGKDLSYLDICK